MRLVGGKAPPKNSHVNTITLTPENCFLAYDLLRDMEISGEKEWLFRVEAEPAALGEDRAFHIALFFDRLARLPGLSAEKKIYYRHAAKCLARGDAVPPYEGFLGLMPLSRKCVDIIGAAGRRRASRRSLKPIVLPAVNPPDRPSPGSWENVLITGWYGTETTGDKAILAELVRFIRQRSPSCRITLTTIDEKISRKTNGEVDGLEGAGLVEIRKGANPRLIEECDAVIIGGGPLMQSESMGFIRNIFVEANRRKKARVVFGCGMGPFHTGDMEAVAADILELSTAGFFRDEESSEYAARLVPGRTFVSACDPAIGYIKRWARAGGQGVRSGNGPVIATLLRATTGEFSQGKSKGEVERVNAENASKIAKILEPICEAGRACVEMLAMNAPWIGGDDRVFNRAVASHLGGRPEVVVMREYQPLEEVARSLSKADAAVAMRYHGHLFCLALGIPFLSIDYTGKKGKVSSLLKRIGFDTWAVQWDGLNPGEASAKLLEIIEKRNELAGRLSAESDRMASLLEETYSQVFGPCNVL